MKQITSIPSSSTFSSLHVLVPATGQDIYPQDYPWCQIFQLEEGKYLFKYTFYLTGQTLTLLCHETTQTVTVEEWNQNPLHPVNPQILLGKMKILQVPLQGQWKGTDLQQPPSTPSAPGKPYRRLEKVAYVTSRIEKCGITTYTRFLTQQLNKNVVTSLHPFLGEIKDGPSLIHSQIEFGILPSKEMVLDGKTDRFKVVTWHTVLVNPGGLLDYYQSVDQEYDAHIVHSALAKNHLSKYVKKPIYIIPHGSVLFQPHEKTEARKKLSLPLDAQIIFAFGFLAENKGYQELFQIEGRMRRDFPRFLLLISGAPHGMAGEHGQKMLEDLNQKRGESTQILGRFLSEEEINLYLSASDLLIFNYEDHPNVISASGALHRCLASARPIVGSRVPRMGDLQEGHHALKFTPHNLDELEKCLFQILTDPIMADHLGRNARTLAEETSWERIAQRHLEVYRMILQKGILYGPDYYDEAYFDTSGKTYHTPNGKTRHWGYCKSSTENWLGWIDVVKGLEATFNPRKVLDVGTGTGGLIHFLLESGVEAAGFDFSKYATKHPYKRARETMVRADALHSPFRDKAFDLVTVCDLLEHVYEDDLPQILLEIQRLSQKHIFYNIGSITAESSEYYVLQKGKIPSLRWEPTAVSGHVNVRPPHYWRNKLEGNGWKIRDDLEKNFRRNVPKEVLANWQLIVVTEREG